MPVSVDGKNVSDIFSNDTSLNTQLWTMNGPVLQNTASSLGENFVSLQLSFSKTGMTMGGVNGLYQMTGMQSNNNFTPPFTVQTTVEGNVATGNPFTIFLVSRDLQNKVLIFGDTDPNSGYTGIWAGNSQYHDQDTCLDAHPQNNIFYSFTITVDKNGKANITLSHGNNILGTLDNVNAGTAPLYLILGQYEGYPNDGPGPNQAIWQLASVSSSLIIPTVTSISPISGPTAGGTSVSINGTGFTGATAVTFGTRPATSFTFNGDTSITAVSPAQTAGVVDVTVTTPYGTSATSPTDEFSYTSVIPEFPSPVIPVIVIIGLLGTVLFIRRTIEH